MAVLSGILFRLEAETAQFQARIAAAQAAMDRMGRAPIAATRGIALMRSSMEQLSSQLLGIPGPAGTALRALTAFGGPEMLAITAAVGGFVLVARALDAPLRDIKKLADEAAKGARAMMAELGGPNVVLALRLWGPGGISEQLVGAREKLEKFRTGAFAGDFQKRQEAIALAEQAVNDLLRQQQGILQLLDKTHQDMADKALKEERVQLELQNQAMQLQVKLAGDLKNILEAIQPADVSAFLLGSTGLPELMRRPFGRGAFQTRPTGFGMARFQPPELTGFPRFGASFGLGIDPERIGVARKELDNLSLALEQAGVGAGQMEAAVVSAFGTMITSVISDTDRMAAVVVSGFFSMVGQILAAERAMAIQRATIAASAALAGGATTASAAATGAAAGGFLASGPGAIAIAGVAIVGSIIGGILGKRKEVQPVRDDRNFAELQRLREQLAKRRPVIVNTYIVDPITGQARKIKETVAESERFDAVSRFGAGNVVEVEG